MSQFGKHSTISSTIPSLYCVKVFQTSGSQKLKYLLIDLLRRLQYFAHNKSIIKKDIKLRLKSRIMFIAF